MEALQKELDDLSAFPIEFFDRLRERQKVWAPFYTIHKIMAGNLDMYAHCGNQQALDVAEKMAGWTADYVRSLSYEHMQRVLGTEYGGMGEVLANLYAVTGKRHYLEVAQRFDHQQFFDPLAGHRERVKRVACQYPLSRRSSSPPPAFTNSPGGPSLSRHRRVFLGRGGERGAPTAPEAPAITNRGIPIPENLPPSSAPTPPKTVAPTT